MTKEGLIIVSGAAAGADPYSPKSWSGSSLFLLQAFKEHGGLSRAIGTQAGKVQYLSTLARTYHRDRSIWRNRLYLDVRYRHALTASLGRQLSEDDSNNNIVQFNGYYDSSAFSSSSRSCFAYYDGTLALRLQSGFPLHGVSAKVIDTATEYEKSLVQNLTGIFTMSEHVRRSFIDDYNAPPDKVVAVGAGFNLAVTPPVRDCSKVVTDKVLFLGGDFERKGGWTLLEAFRIARKKVPNASLEIVGPRNLVIPEGLSAGVRSHGFLDKSGPVIHELFATCGMFVLPSLHEPFGIAPLEAMLHGMPAVVTGEWALAEMVIDGLTGLHTPSGDSVLLAERLVRLMEDPKRAAKMGAAGRTHVVSNYSWGKVARRILAETGTRSQLAKESNEGIDPESNA